MLEIKADRYRTTRVLYACLAAQQATRTHHAYTAGKLRRTDRQPQALLRKTTRKLLRKPAQHRLRIYPYASLTLEEYKEENIQVQGSHPPLLEYLLSLLLCR